ncbi:MAG TPA: hypothetical protein VFO89_16590 [Thermoanaerobaculia bacterium]|nr:hypothetical protein [Thermoanaerobaculia bacterium]
MAASCSALFTPRDSHNYRIFTWWMTGAMLAFAAATILIDGKYIPDALGWGLTALSVGLMLASIRSYIYFLRHADELLRKVHLDALALSFGIGTVAMMGYRLCERLGAPKLDINDPFLVMIVVWALGQWAGMRRYTGGEEA